MAERFEFTLDSVEAVMIGGAVGGDVRRFPLRIRNTTTDPVRFAKLAVRVRDELERRGLSSGDELHPSVRTAMALFTEHQVSVSVTGRDAEEKDLAMVAMSDGAQAVTVTQAPRSDTLRLTLFSDEELVSAIARFLPAAPAAPRGTFAVEHHPRPTVSAMAARRRAQAAADAEDDDAFGNLDVVGTLESGPARPAPRRSDAERLGDIMSGERLGVGFLTAAGRRRSGERRSVPPVGWVDTAVGRYLVETTTDDYGSTYATYRPAGGPEVEQAVKQLISRVY